MKPVLKSGFIFALCFAFFVGLPTKLLASSCYENLAVLTGNLPFESVEKSVFIKDRRAVLESPNRHDVVDFIVSSVEKLGFKAKLQNGQDMNKPGVKLTNVIVRLNSNKLAPKIVVGAHYDSAAPFEAADDNGTGVVAMFELSLIHI